MGKVILIMISVAFLISGCTSSEKVGELEKKMEEFRSDLDFYKSKVDSLEARQDTFESNLAAKQQEAPAPGSDTVLSAQDIQTALKNAGFYSGEIDGKVGPETDKAIKSFQETNGLKADGIVGAKTRGLLVNYLTQPQAETTVIE